MTAPLLPIDCMQPHIFRYQTPDGAEVTLPYRLFLPAGQKEPLPLLLYLHGAGERGTDNCAQITAHAQLLTQVCRMQRCIVLAPQCPEDAQWVDVPWSLGSYRCTDYGPSRYLRAVQALVRTMPQLGADARRLYAAGISMGGYGVWRLVMDDPHLFAAAIPICGGADPARAASLTDLPLWTFHGADDPTVPVSGTREMAAAIRAAGGTQLRYTEYPHTGHESWLTAYQEPELLPWLFSQVNPCPAI